MSSQAPTAKRLPLILVTDLRNLQTRGRPAPFAGHHFKEQKRKPSRFAEISVSNLLTNVGDIPSAQRRVAPRRLSATSVHSLRDATAVERRRPMPKFSGTLPLRTLKGLQKLVLIPDDTRDSRGVLARSRTELMLKEQRDEEECSRVTAYLISGGFDLDRTNEFLSETHDVAPRVYDNVVYVPYVLPLLPGSDGYRVRSNTSVKARPAANDLERMFDRAEEADHLYEYYSGVETPEDVNNPSLGEDTSDGPFDPLEPQFFAPAELYNTTKTIERLAEMFIFQYGVVVFWNFTEVHEKNILADLAFARGDGFESLLKNPINESDFEREEFHFEYDESADRPRIYNDMITLRLGDHMIKLTMLHAIAQSTKLSVFELRMVHSLLSILKLPKRLALTGRLGLTHQQLLQKLGRLFKLRVDVNLSSRVLDTPEFFWSFEPSLHPLYSAVRDYLEIGQRVQVINDRCKVFWEFSEMIGESIDEKAGYRVTWMIILIIGITLSVSLFELALRWVKA